jgi:hypothetical protein
MDVVKTLRYRFVRYCVNKAYVDLDLSGVPAEIINVLDDVVNQIRDLEKYITSEESAVRVIRVDLPERLRILKERDPALAETFAKNIVKYCLELEEVANSKFKEYFEELLSRF